MLTEVLIFLAVVALIMIFLRIFHVGVKIIVRLLINALVGGLILFLINLIPGIDLPINIFTAVMTGIFGIPAVLVILIISII